MSHRRSRSRSLLDEMGEAAAAAAAVASEIAAAEEEEIERGTEGHGEESDVDSVEADDDFEEDNEEDYYAESIVGADELVVVEEGEEEDSTEPSMGAAYDDIALPGRDAPPHSTALGPLQEEGDNSNTNLGIGDGMSVGHPSGPPAVDFGYYYDESASSFASSGISSDPSFFGGGAGGHRRSFASFNSNATSSEADLSIKSAPTVMRRESGRSSIIDPSTSRAHRRVTINSPKDPPFADTAGGASRSSISRPRRQKLYGSARNLLAASRSDEFSGSSSNLFRGKRTALGRRISSQLRQSTDGSWEAHSMAAAADRLGSHEHNAAWENAAAAAAVVAASSAQAPGKRQHVLYGKGDFVLVLLNLLNITNHDDDRSFFTIDPVNGLGYPVGEGKTEEERQGPFSYLLCCVNEVHFDEDERYYTVTRLDTGTFQRADPGWMEPFPPQAENWEAAQRAAKRTVRSQSEDSDDEVNKYHRETFFLTPLRFTQSTVYPWYKETRASTKILAENILWGKHGWSCRIHITVINLLVISSFIYLFIETFTLAFLPKSLDYPFAILELVVWCILAVELFLEYIIRPAGYHKLILSDKAYAPATARHINHFHLLFESISLLLFIPRLFCIAQKEVCDDQIAFGLVEASFNALVGESYGEVALGRFVMGLTFLRAFGLVRHWKQTWINATFDKDRGIVGRESEILRQLLLLSPTSLTDTKGKGFNLFRRKKLDDDQDWQDDDATHPSSEKDQKLQMNAKIGTALMLINSHRALLMMLSIFTIFPIIYSIGKTNRLASNQVQLLQANNLAANSTADCDYLEKTVTSWLKGSAGVDKNNTYVFILWAQVLPIRCPWQRPEDGVITYCNPNSTASDDYFVCKFWNATMPKDPSQATPAYFGDILGVRDGGIISLNESTLAYGYFNTLESNQTYQVRAIFDQTQTLTRTTEALFYLLLTMLILTLVGLTVMRGDAKRLVLDPLQRMLKIIIRYAEDPLTQTDVQKPKSRKHVDGNGAQQDEEELGNYETEQLINAISKIADLLRKCWGVAGAGIISENLRTKDGKTVVFNPMVKGKRVYALFGFIAINDFSKLLRDLDNDVMILINDVAHVVHDEVYRWALGDSGQCNKNLGGAFLMVFRIGDFSEVHARKKRATDVVFKSQMKRNVRPSQRSLMKRGTGKRRRAGNRQVDIKTDGTLQLASLPGIQSFTDRALLGLLKSFAGIHRDKKLRNWRTDFRISGGVGAFTANVIYGMDAGWAVEGAVGSEYKIDATYLSPHVNMASRMMSAAKQYGVTILLSQAVEELLSRTARDKLRHLDTVYVKGSSVAQRIFTYDARYQGVDFFLYERPPDQADIEAEIYTPNIWEVDQDLRAMRQHVTDDFMDKFTKGVDQYLEGDWKKAIETLHEADNIMIQTVLEQGYVDFDLDGLEEKVFNREEANEEVTRIRNEVGDGSSKCLIQFMQRRNATAPEDWHGVRQLMSK